MRRPRCFMLTFLLSLTALWACPRDKVSSPSPDVGAAAVAKTPSSTSRAPECPTVRRQPIALPEGASSELKLTGSAPGLQARPVALLLAATDELSDGMPAVLVDELTRRQLSVVEVIGLREGEAGKKDLLLARSLALRGSCEADPSRVAIIASPKTGAVALEVATSTAAELRPAALVFLSGGDYTEARAEMDTHRSDLESVPMLFVYSDKDAAWSTRFQGEPTSPLWLFRRQSGDAHGFALLSGNKETADDVAVFLEGFLQ